MSGRRARQQRAEQDAKLRRILADAATATPEYVRGHGSLFESWSVGPILVIVPALRDDYPAEVKDAFDRRRRATLTGRCDCGGGRTVQRGRIIHQHERDSRDDVIDDLCRRHAGTWRRTP